MVATDHGGPPEIVARATARRRAGRPPGDAEALATALLELLPKQTTPERRRARLPAFTPPPARSPSCSGISAGLAVGDGLFAHPLAQRVLQLGLLDEDVVLGRQRGVGRSAAP